MTNNHASECLSPNTKLNNYSIRSVLGRGAFGITYLAFDEDLQSSVAIKEYLPQEFATRNQDNTVHPLPGEKGDLFEYGLESFLREARTIAKFKHPNIVRVIAFFRKNKTAYIVMEYEKGRTLKQFIKEKVNLTEAHLLSIFCPISKGLMTVHQLGYIHRDIKPDNIVIREDKTPVLIDFGTARDTDNSDSGDLTQIFTNGYAPYEQCQPKWYEQGPWTDIYSLGATLYFSVTGERVVSAQFRIVDDSFEPLVRQNDNKALENYSDGFLNAINKALSFHPEDRPENLMQWEQMLCDTDNQALLSKNDTTDAADATETVDNTTVITSNPLPFHPNRPCNEPDEHIGRQTLVQHAFGKLGTDDVQSFAVIGFYKSGKTSFINYLQHEETLDNYLQDKKDSYIFLNIDLSIKPLKNADEFFTLFFSHVQEQLGLKALSEIADLDKISHWLEDNQQKLVVILDNFDLVITNANYEVSFYESLRSWFSTNPNVGCIVTSPVQLLHLAVPTDLAGSPFFNIFGSYTLTALTKEEATRLITERLPFPLSEQKNDIARLIEDVGVNPYELQIAGDSWLKAFESDNITEYKTMSDEAYSQCYEYYQLIYSALTKKQTRIIKSLLGNQSSEHSLSDPDMLNRGWLTDIDGKKALASVQMRVFFEEIFEIEKEDGINILKLSKQFFKRIYERAKQTERGIK